MRRTLPLAAFCVSVACAAAHAPADDAVPDSFNYVLGTQTIGSAYHFTDEPPLVEGARAVLAMGSNVIKFRMATEDVGKDAATRGDSPVKCLKDLAQQPSYKQVLGMPFAYYLIWALPLGAGDWHGGFPQALQDKEYREVYDLSCHLLSTYSGSNKTFYLGHWEGDWMLRGTGRPASAVTPLAIEGMIRWLNVRQKAVDDAGRDTPHKNVRIFNYAEVNRVRDAMNGQTSVTNDVLPHTTVDYVSYSSYDSADGGLGEALDYIASKLPVKSGVPGKRVFIGEYGFPAKRFSPAQQDVRSRRIMRDAIQWGCPFVLYWEMYNNEVEDGRQAGYWLIDDKGARQPVYYTHQAYYRWAREFVAGYRRDHGTEPAQERFRDAAVAWLNSPGSN
jgi:hypothetical protein